MTEQSVQLPREVAVMLLTASMATYHQVMVGFQYHQPLVGAPRAWDLAQAIEETKRLLAAEED